MFWAYLFQFYSFTSSLIQAGLIVVYFSFFLCIIVAVDAIS